MAEAPVPHNNHQVYSGKELRDWRFEQLSTDPTGGDLYAGRAWFNTTTNRLCFYDGTEIVKLDKRSEITPFRSFVDQVPAADNVPETILFEVAPPGTPVSVSYSAGVFTFPLGGRLSLDAFFSIDRTENGPDEAMWFWMEVFVSGTGWVQFGDTFKKDVVRDRSTSFTVATFADVPAGTQLRARMEVQDASEACGLYTEAGTATHNAVPSARITLTMIW